MKDRSKIYEPWIPLRDEESDDDDHDPGGPGGGGQGPP